MNAERARVTLLYVLLLLAHLVHVAEEAWGGFWLIDAFYGMERFLAVNALLFTAAVLLSYATYRGHGWAYRLSLVYAALMALQGVGHNVATLITGRYFGGSAGGFSGVAMFLIGVPLVGALRARMQAAREEQTPSEIPEPGSLSSASSAAGQA